ncbi:MAG: response regulator transcription factor [Thermoanaerobaculia bacterium]|nr:response regulator transcription factor [Thermoanaerobaculia bacterium]
MNELSQTVFIVDDDADVCDSLSMLVQSVGLEAETFDQAVAFLEAYEPDRSGCLVLDIRMPGMSGLDLQRRLNEMNAILPIIFITGHGDVPAAVRAMRAGAVDFLQKPFDEQVLLDRIHQSLGNDARHRRELAEKDLILERIATLTVREREVMNLVIKGLANKNVAGQLGVSQRTVEIHRARVMEKTQATSLAHLVRMAMSVDA